jgi:hypothetical protein
VSIYCYTHLLHLQICLLYPLNLILFSAWFCPSLWLGLLALTQLWMCILLSSETLTAEFFMMLHLWIYALNVSLRCCTQALTSSMDAGRLYVDLKLLMNCFVSSS